VAPDDGSLEEPDPQSGDDGCASDPTEDPEPEPTDSASSSPGPLPAGIPTDLPTAVPSAVPGVPTPSPSAEPSESESEDPEAEPEPCESSTPATAFDTETRYTGATGARYDDTVTLSARVANFEGATAPSGSVTFTVGSIKVTAPVKAGVATVRKRIVLAPNNYLLTARYSGMTGWRTSYRESVFRVAKTSCRLTLARSASSSGSTLTSTLKFASGRAIAGANVGFSYNGRSLGAAKTSSTGGATLRTAERRSGTYVARWAGNSNSASCSRSLNA
jgi:hypothetical protein